MPPASQVSQSDLAASRAGRAPCRGRRVATWRRWAIAWLALALGVAVPASARAERQYIADLWQQGSGLPQNYVYTILQTRDGYLWVGTRGGLARFDGVRFTTYDDRTAGQLGDSEVWALAEGKDGALWIGTYGGGLSCLKDGRFQTFGIADGLPSELVTSLATDRDGSLWVGTAAGLVRSQGGRFESFGKGPDVPGGSVNALHTDPAGRVWIGTTTGLWSYADGRFENHTAAHPAELSGYVMAIAGGGAPGLWVGIHPTRGNRGGIRVLQGDRITSYGPQEGLASEYPVSIVLDGEDAWVGARPGLYRFHAGRFQPYVSDVWGFAGVRVLERVATQRVPALAIDHEGSLWFGTQMYGLGRLRRAPLLNVTGSGPGGTDIDVRSIFQDQRGAMWLGTAKELRRIGDEKTDIYPMPRDLPAEVVAAAPDGTIAIGSTDGLFRLSSGRVELWPGMPADGMNVTVLKTVSNGDFWIGTRLDGAYRKSGNTLTHFTSRDGLLGDQVRAIAEDKRGGIWIGTRPGGVTCLRAGRVTTYGPAEGLPGAHVAALLVDRTDTVWVATRKGLTRIKEGRPLVSITAAQGLPSNYFYQLVEDGQHLWMTCALGIARVALEDLEHVADGLAPRVEVDFFGAESGMGGTLMLGSQGNAVKAPDGRLWFATTRGAAVIDLPGMVRNTIPPQVHVEAVAINKQPFRETRDLVLGPDEREVEIRYTALSFMDPLRVRFKYWLEGFDRGWVDAGTERLAHYTNLPNGRYRFRVIASNNDGVWNEAGASLPFEVLPHWYERQWVRPTAALLVVLAAFAAHRFRLAKHRQREEELSLRVQERTNDLAQVMAGLEDRIAARTAELASANEALSAEKERLAVTLASIGDGVIATDVDGRVILMNRVAEELTGWSVTEAAHQTVAAVFRTVHRDTRAVLPDLATRVLAEGHTIEVAEPRVLVARDGSERLVADSAAPISDPEGRIVGAVFVFRDVTEREQIDEQLRNAQKLEALGVLAGGLAHDFNNLLTGIFGFVDLASTSAEDPASVRDATGRAMSVLDKARGLTRQLLTFSKAGEPVRRATALGPLVRQTVGFVLAGSRVRASLEVAPDLWPCEIDEQQISQVVDNLVINARQAMPGGGTVWVKLCNEPGTAAASPTRPAGPLVRLTIEDEGPGIARELWPRVFEPFFTTKAAGTGLGLATVYSIVRRHGGRVEVGHATSGTGARFDVFLPAVPRGAPHVVHAPVPPAPVPASSLARVLVMDDEDYVRSFARAALTRLGYQATVARDDQEAVALAEAAKARGERLDALILDLTIPGGAGGVEALQRLRAVFPGIPAIASSGYSVDAVMARPAEHGFDAALPKPYTLADLNTTLARTLESRSPGTDIR